MEVVGQSLQGDRMGLGWSFVMNLQKMDLMFVLLGEINRKLGECVIDCRDNTKWKLKW